MDPRGRGRRAGADDGLRRQQWRRRPDDTIRKRRRPERRDDHHRQQRRVQPFVGSITVGQSVTFVNSSAARTSGVARAHQMSVDSLGSWHRPDHSRTLRAPAVHVQTVSRQQR